MSNFTDFVGGSGGLPINTILFINHIDDVITTNDGSIWLKEGVFETNTNLYPDAFTSTISVISFNTLSEDVSPRGMTWDGNNVWVVGISSDRVYKYNSDGSYTGTSFSVGSQDSQPNSVLWDGTHFWVSGAVSGRLYKYTAAGVYTGTSFNIGTSKTGATWDGTSFWILGGTTASEYNSSGIATGTSFSVSGQDSSPSGMTWDGTHFWLVGQTTDTAYRYDASGAYTGESVDVSPLAEDPTGIASNLDGGLFVSGQSGSIRFFGETVGIPSSTSDYNYYVRVK